MTMPGDSVFPAARKSIDKKTIHAMIVDIRHLAGLPFLAPLSRFGPPGMRGPADNVHALTLKG
jgi:hypothetical protein